MEWIQANLETIVALALVFLAAFPHIAALTPWTGDDKLVPWVKKLADFLAANYGNAKNASNAKSE